MARRNIKTSYSRSTRYNESTGKSEVVLSKRESYTKGDDNWGAFHIFVLIALFFGTGILSLLSRDLLDRSKENLYQQFVVEGFSLIDDNDVHFYFSDYNDTFRFHYLKSNYYFYDVVFDIEPLVFNEDYTITFYLTDIDLGDFDYLKFYFGNNDFVIKDFNNTVNYYGDYFYKSFEFVSDSASTLIMNSYNNSETSFGMKVMINKGHTLMGDYNSVPFISNDLFLDFTDTDEMSYFGNIIMNESGVKSGFKIIDVAVSGVQYIFKGITITFEFLNDFWDNMRATFSKSNWIKNLFGNITVPIVPTREWWKLW